MILFDINRFAVAVSCPEDLAPDLGRIFLNFGLAGDREPNGTLNILPAINGTFSLTHKATVLWEDLTAESLPGILCTEIENFLAANSLDTALRAGAVTNGKFAVMVAGSEGCGKSAMVAWLIQNGFGYLADNYISLATSHADEHNERNAISPLPLPLAMHAHQAGLYNLDIKQIVKIWDRRLYAALPAFKRSKDRVETCRLAIFPRYQKGSRFEITPLTPTEFEVLLAQTMHPNQTMTVFNAARLSSFVSRVPAISVRFGDYGQLKGKLDRFIRDLLEQELRPNRLADFCRNWGRSKKAVSTSSAPGPVSDPRRAWRNGQRPKLTIGMATFDDFDGVYFTLQSLRMHHREIANDVEFLVVDNNPDGPCGEPLRHLEKKIPNYRYVSLRERSGTAVRDYVMAEATSEYVLNLDCHVLLEPGSVARLIHYFEENPETNDLLQGPLVWDELDRVSTHMKPVWRAGFFGTWAQDKRGEHPDNPPFEIPMHGLGLYACRRAAWPGYHPMFRGFGGEEGYIHEKFRQRGGRTLCLPFLRWLHRFHRPLGVPYRIKWEDRIWNYLIGAKELGLHVDSVIEHFREHLGKSGEALIASVVRAVFGSEKSSVSSERRVCERQGSQSAINREIPITGAPSAISPNPFDRFGMLAYINLDRDTSKRRALVGRLKRMGVDKRFTRFSAVETPDNHHIGCALSHRNVIAEARRRQVKNILVLEDDAIFHRDIMTLLPIALNEAELIEWDILYFGGRIREESLRPIPGCKLLHFSERVTATHAVVYNSRVFDRILTALPDTVEGMREWISQNIAIDQYFRFEDYKKIVCYPVLSIQPSLISGWLVNAENFRITDIHLSEL